MSIPCFYLSIRKQKENVMPLWLNTEKTLGSPWHKAGNLRVQGLSPGSYRQPLTPGCQKTFFFNSEPYSGPLIIDFSKRQKMKNWISGRLRRLINSAHCIPNFAFLFVK